MILNSKIGFGGGANGEIVVLPEDVKTEDLTMDLAGKVLIFLTSPSKEILEKTRFLGVSGVVVPEMHFRDFEYFKEMGEFVIIVLQRFGVGPLEKELKDKLSKLSGKKGEVNGEQHEIKIG